MCTQKRLWVIRRSSLRPALRASPVRQDPWGRGIRLEGLVTEDLAVASGRADAVKKERMAVPARAYRKGE